MVKFFFSLYKLTTNYRFKKINIRFFQVLFRPFFGGGYGNMAFQSGLWLRKKMYWEIPRERR